MLDRFTLSQITVHAANRPPAAAATTAASHVIVGATRVRAPARAASYGMRVDSYRFRDRARYSIAEQPFEMAE